MYLRLGLFILPGAVYLCMHLPRRKKLLCADFTRLRLPWTAHKRLLSVSHPRLPDPP